MKHFTKPIALLCSGLIAIAVIGFGLRSKLDGVPRLKLPGVPVGPPSLVSGARLHTGIAWLASDGSLWFLGQDYSGISGAKGSCSRIPWRIGEIHDWKSMAATGDQFVGIRRDGSVWGWNASGYGNDKTMILPSASPQRIVPGTNWIQSVSSGGGAFYLLSAEGSLWAAGRNGSGELGNGSFLANSKFAAVTRAHRWRSVAASIGSAAAIATNGTLWVWGMGRYPSPKQVGNASNWIQLMEFNSVFTAQNSEGDWAIWSSGQISFPEASTSPNEPMAFLPNSHRWSSVISSGRSYLARNREGKYEHWGFGFPQMNSKFPKHRNIPQPIELPHGADEIHLVGSSPDTMLAWSSDGTLWAWGAIPGAVCQYSWAEQLRIRIVDILKGVGIDRPGLRSWAAPTTMTTRFIPVAHFVAP